MKDLSNVMMIEFTENYGSLSENYYAVFNINKISAGEVLEHVNIFGSNGYHPAIMVVSPEQWKNVFGDE